MKAPQNKTLEIKKDDNWQGRLWNSSEVRTIAIMLHLFFLTNNFLWHLKWILYCALIILQRKVLKTEYLILSIFKKSRVMKVINQAQLFLMINRMSLVLLIILLMNFCMLLIGLVKNSFPILQSNISSLNKNFEKLQKYLNANKGKFSYYLSKHPSWWRRLEKVLKTSWRRLSSLFSEYVFKTSSRRLLDQGEYIRLDHKSSEDAFKTSSRRLEQDEYIRLCQDSLDVSKTSCKNIFKTSSKLLFLIRKGDCVERRLRRVFRIVSLDMNNRRMVRRSLVKSEY